MRELREQSPTLYSDVSVSVVPIRTAITGAARLRLFVLMGAAAFVLVIACANVAGVLLSRALARRHELAVRVALGAGRRRLLRQFMAEGVVLAAAGALLGLFVAQLGIITLRRITTTALPEGTTFSLEPKVLLFALGVAVVSAFAASLVPSLAATRALGIAFRHDDGRASASRASRRIRLGLVAGQLAVSVVLLVGAGLFLRTLHGLLALNLGYTTEHVLTFRNVFTQPKRDAEQDAFYRALYAGLRSLPRVISVGGGAVPTTGSSFITGLEIEGRTVERARLPQVRNSTASDDYFAALGIPILRGRAFNAQDHESDPWVGVIGDRLAKEQWPRADPIGARVKLDPQNPWITIVGIVGDVRMGGAEEAQPSVYTSQRQDHWPGGSSVVIRTDGDPLALAANVRQVVRRVDPSVLIVGLRSLDEFRRSTPSIAERRMLLQLLVTFAVVALMVSAIGVYGVSAYATEARRREFGIRIALGATRNGVLRLALREAAQVAVSGTLAGVPLALLLARRLGAMLYQVAPFDPLTLSAVLGALFLVVMAASFVPARRATLIDPARTMRTE
jgi:predicted permease